MINNTNAELFPVYAAIPLTKLLFDLVVVEDDVLEISRLVLRQTKNTNTRTYLLLNAPIVDCHVPLPDCIFEVKGVFHAENQPKLSKVPMSVLATFGRQHYDWEEPMVSNSEVTADAFRGDTPLYDASDLLTCELSMEDELSLRNLNKHETIDYNYCDQQLSFRQKTGRVNVIYTIKPKDCDGVEQVTEAVIEAIAYRFNQVDMMKRFRIGKATGDQMRWAQEESERKIAQARAGGRISDNARKKILDVMNSFDRHQYGTTKN